MSRREVLQHIYASDLIRLVKKPLGWAVEGFWVAQSQGVVAGEPKTYKSMFTLDMAVSIASGLPFLNAHKVKQGTVLIVQEENDEEIMKDRLVKIMSAKRLVPEDKIREVGTNTFNIKFATHLPLIFINRRNFSLNDENNLKDLTSVIINENVKMLILDPFYTMFDGNLNDMQSVKEALKVISSFNRKFKMSVILVHHNHKTPYNVKPSFMRGGQKMLGSMGMHAWTASGLYLTKEENRRNVITIEREFRAFPEMSDVRVVFSEGKAGSFGYGSSEAREQQNLVFK